MQAKRTALIVLNRNLPGPTDALCQRFAAQEGDYTDIYVVESGSDADKLSRYCSWHVATPEATQHGLRTSRGFNHALYQLQRSGKLQDYEYVFLVTNDSVFDDSPVIARLSAEMERHPKLGVLSPCSRRWGELRLLQQQPTRYFWYVHNTAYFMRRAFIESLMNTDDELTFLYDGNNFRGYGAETELIAKGYANDWATAITSRVFVEENEQFLREQSELIRTESYEENIRLYLAEGREWMRRKYGFTSRWQMQMYAHFWYDKFFEFHPEFNRYKI